MRVFFVGDFVKNTGPGVANKLIRKGLKNNSDMMYSDARHKVTRIFEMVYKTIKSDCVCFCSPSFANIIGIKIAKFFNKKSFYLMHGYLTYENKINETELDETKSQNLEKYIFTNVEKVFCVSKKFMEFMKKAEPNFKDKFDYNHNGLDLYNIENNAQIYKKIKNDKQIVSIGGGMRRKNNLTVCRAIEKLNREKGLDLKFVVIGLPYTDKEQICSYSFVTYYDKIPHEKALKILAESYLYIQNSSFETFGLAVIEALASNCNLLISNNVGAAGVINTIENSDLILNTSDIDEIATKIENLLINGNASRLKQGINKQEVQFNEAARLLVSKISKYIGEK